ncbi:hypothetical protein MLD38_000959 [Melastoma candidum]|uniref:Uncharacterized protein n=1 Tax=Melastoma candidum TaxID=119954 RepID=A0ACB9SBQ8_9MYRT|nr:hypothetical protein MLD38_000959 [Melastoma candidum]
MKEDEGDNSFGNKRRPSAAASPFQEKQESLKLYGALVFGVIGALVTTMAVLQLRRTVDWVYEQVPKSRTSKKSFHSAFPEEAWQKYYRKMEVEYTEKMERVARIRRMQRIFMRERNKYKRSYDKWRQNDPNAYTYYEHFEREDWYWRNDSSFRNNWSNHQETFGAGLSHPMSHHYSVLGLDRTRQAPYTEAEIKSAFRAKAMELHPDLNQNNKEDAEERFKEVLASYEAIKQERKF